MVRIVTDDDIGLKVLRAAPTEAANIIDIVAIHGIGAHPDDSWCKNVGTKDSPKWVNWLEAEDMLPAVAPQARIMRYGYQSQWFGEGAMRQRASTLAQRLLLALRRKREECPYRPLVFVAHCFGGLVVLKALLDAHQYESEWPGLFVSTTGLLFLGTPFRGAEGMSQVEMLAAARREYEDDEIQVEVLKILEPGNEFLQEVVDQFGKTRSLANKAQVACFYELKATNVGKVVGKTDRTRFVVSESSGCLDLSDATSKYSLSRTHFDMNKFGKPTEEDFETVSEVVKRMVKASPQLVLARSQYDSKHKIDFSLRGVPIVSQFVARQQEMQGLERILLDPVQTPRRRNVAVVHGLGGIGKTQLAVEFARKYKDSFSGVFWLNGSSEASLKQSFADVLQRLPRAELSVEGVEMLKQYTAAIEVDVAVRECIRWLSLPTNDSWLLIFDNVDRDYGDRKDPQAYNVKTYFPHADHGSILITSRLAGLQTHGIGLKVGTVGAQQARTILENNAGRAVENADVVLQLLHGLPLALTQAGSYIQETNVSASTYAKYHNDKWKQLMQKQDRFPLEEYGDRSVLTTWVLSYEQVQRRSEEAAWLMKLWGFLDSGELWYELVARVSSQERDMEIPPCLLKIAQDDIEFSDAAGLLVRYSLAEAKVGTGSYSMHSVLHRWCGQLADETEQHCLCRLAAGVIVSSMPSSRKDIESWKKRKRLLGHGASISRRIEELWADDGKGTSEICVKPRHLHSLGSLLAEEHQQAALKMYKRALIGKEKTQGPEHTSTLHTVNSLGILYDELGEHELAEKMLQRALVGMNKERGPEHTSTLRAVQSLGILYAKMNKHNQAEEMFLRALHNKEKVYGPEHTSTLSTVMNLGTLNVVRNKYKEAEEMYLRALDGIEKAQGPEHMSTLDTSGNLGLLYVDMNRHKEAEEILLRVFTNKERLLGSEHTSTLDTTDSLGILYMDTNRYEEANAMLSRAVEGFNKAWGPEHASTLDSVSNLGLLYVKMNKYKEAKETLLRALDGKEKIWGPEHTSTLGTVNNLGLLYKDTNRHREAEMMYTRTLNRCRTAKHTDSLLTCVPALDAMWGLALLSEKQAHVEEARAWYEKALSGFETVFGNEYHKCETLRASLAALEQVGEGRNAESVT